MMADRFALPLDERLDAPLSSQERARRTETMLLISLIEGRKGRDGGGMPAATSG